MKNPPAMQETWVQSLVVQSLEQSNGKPLQYSCLENPMHREAWLATVQRVAESDMIEVTEHTCTNAQNLNFLRKEMSVTRVMLYPYLKEKIMSHEKSGKNVNLQGQHATLQDREYKMNKFDI